MADTFNKRFSSGEVFTIPYEANKQWEITSSLFPEYNVFGALGIKPSTPNIEEYTEENLLYKSVLANFYSEFYPTSNLSTSSYYQTINYTSSLTSEDYAVSGALIIGNQATTIKNFPTSPNSEIYILNVPTSLYSNRLLPTTVELELAGGYKIYDDGEYNIFWSGSNVSSSRGNVISQSSQIGNVFYEQGLIVFTSIPFIPNNIIPMVNSISSTDEICPNSGTITVVTTDGSGNFTYELIETSTIITPPINTNTVTFTSLPHGGYNVKITDNITGLIQILPTIINISSPIPITSGYLSFTTNAVRNDQWQKIIDVTYTLNTTYIDPNTGLPTLGIPPGVTLEVIYDQDYEFRTNYNVTTPHFTMTAISGVATTAPLVITKNGVSTNASFNTLPPSPTIPICNAPTVTTSNRVYRNNTIQYTGTDTFSVTARMVLNTPIPATSGCPSEGGLKLTLVPWSLRQINPCGTRTNINFVTNPNTGVLNPTILIRN
jgi:hypothetical protein